MARLDATGALIVHTSVTEQGQGTEAIVAQVAATALGVDLDKVRVVLGDTDVIPYGGGTWPRAAPALAARRSGRRARP